MIILKVHKDKYYKYKLKDNFVYYSEHLEGINFRNDWVEIRDGSINIVQDYAWDGCSPKQKVTVLGKTFVLGTPDGNKDECKWASLVHDVLCQFREFIHITKKAVLAIFDQMLKEAGWFLRPAYVLSVDKFGPQDWLGD